MTTTATTAAYYGNLSRVAMNFYIQTGNPAELDAAYFYARYAAAYALLARPSLRHPNNRERG